MLKKKIDTLWLLRIKTINATEFVVLEVEVTQLSYLWGKQETQVKNLAMPLITGKSRK